MRDKRFHLENNAHNKDVVKQGEILLNIARKAMSNVKFLGNEDMYCVCEAIDLIDRATANRTNLRRDWLFGHLSWR